MTRTLLLTLAIVLVSLAALFPAVGHATVFGADDRERADAMLDEAEEKLYSATQVIVCRRGRGQEHVAAGNLAGDFTHGISIAHLFHDPVPRAAYTAAECTFEVRDRTGRVLDRVGLKRLRTLWQNDRHSPSNDLAMFELVRRPRHVARFLSLELTPLSVGQELLLVTYHYDVLPYLAKRKTRGRVYSTLNAGDAGMRNIFNTDADAVPMSSGGPLYDREGRVVALIQGESTRDRSPREFGDRGGYNAAIRFDAEFLNTYAEFARVR